MCPPDAEQHDPDGIHFNWDGADNDISGATNWKKASLPWVDHSKCHAGKDYLGEFLETPSYLPSERQELEFQAIATKISLDKHRSHKRTLLEYPPIAWIYDANHDGKPRTYNGVQSERSLHECLGRKVCPASFQLDCDHGYVSYEHRANSQYRNSAMLLYVSMLTYEDCSFPYQLRHDDIEQLLTLVFNFAAGFRTRDL